MVVDLLIQALASDGNFARVNDHHKVTTGHMRCERWFMFAAQNLRDLGCQAAKNLSLSINDVPLRFQVSGLGAICLHHVSPLCFSKSPLDMSPLPGTAHAVGPPNQGALFQRVAR